MLDLTRTVTLMAATVTMGLVAGLFYTFAQAVMPGLGRSDDRTFVAAFQSIDRAIDNVWQLLGFGGALVFTTLALALHLPAEDGWVPVWIAASLALYLVMLVLTLRVHIPLNRAIQAAGPVDAISDLASVRRALHARWVRWNVVRAVVSTCAVACLAWAAMLSGP